ncbi:lipopolysaccharide-induced tumor necrosis factor-alpha factor homolog isoform X2 [Vanacampus margaritifer]
MIEPEQLPLQGGLVYLSSESSARVRAGARSALGSERRSKRAAGIATKAVKMTQVYFDDGFKLVGRALIWQSSVMICMSHLASRSPAPDFLQAFFFFFVNTPMDPPTYEASTLPPSAVDVEAFDLYPPPPPYDASIPHSSNPPPYQENNPFPVLVPTTFSPSTSVNIHLTPLEAVLSQPVSEQTMTTSNLLGSPGNFECPHCRRAILTKTKQMPGRSAYTLCCVLAFSGLVCGFCLIPFMIPELWDVHHYCPHCGKHLHVHHKS